MATPGRALEGNTESRASPPIAPHTIPSIASLDTAPGPLSELNQPGALTSPRAQRTPPKVAHLSPKPGHTGLTFSTSGLRLTGAAAMAEMKRAASKSPISSRQTTPNPAAEVLQTLVGGGGMSRPSDAPAPNKLSEPLRQVAEKVVIPSTMAPADSEEVSPVSLGSFGTVESSGARSSLTATAGEPTTLGQPFVAEPAQMTDEAAPSGSGSLAADQDGNKAFSYPGPPPGSSEPSRPSTSSGLSRGMSLPGYGQGSPKSPASGKRHKCPYCDTDFTRHHNLKSHLLTHSQEKPYICQTCQSRFRRLHDLKRHTKLHTGERPHTCDKCGRRFARGDALARHNKGPGGCAGRRSSFGGEDDYGTDGPSEVMDGVEYTGDSEAYETAEDRARRVSEPSRKRHQPEMPEDPSRQVYRQSSTYPPPLSKNPRDNAGNMAPPAVVHPGSNSNATSPREVSSQSTSANGSSLNSAYYSQGSGPVYSEAGMMTSSPKPLSPGGQPSDGHRLSVSDGTGPGTLGRHRSTSLTTQFQQQHFGRGSTGKTSPRMASQYAPNTQQPGGASTMLPPLSASQQSRGTLPPVASASGSSSLQHPQSAVPGGPSGGLGSNPGSLSSHGRSSVGSMRDAMGAEQSDIWAYVRQVEARMERMKNEYELRIQNLQEEVKIIRAQLSGVSNYGGGGGGGGGDMGPGRY